MLTEQAIGVVVFLILLAIAITGYTYASRNSDRLDRERRSVIGQRDYNLTSRERPTLA